MVRPLVRTQVPWLLGVCAALAVVGCAPPDLTTSYELSGIVSERFESGAVLTPIAGASVTFTSDTGLSTSAVTGGDGRYRMIIESDTPFGTVRATADGFAPSTRSVYFDTPVRRIDLDLRPPTDVMP